MNKETIKKIQENADKVTQCSKLLQDIVQKMAKMNEEEPADPQKSIMDKLHMFYDDHREEIEKVADEYVELDHEYRVPIEGGHYDAVDPSQLITQSRPHYDVELTNATGYLDGDTIYLALRYRVATDVGDVDLLFPKIRLPFSTYELPTIEKLEDTFILNTGENKFWLDDAPHPDYAGMKPASIFEVMKEPPTREMTISEVEEELGYKVKIIGGGCCGGCEE